MVQGYCVARQLVVLVCLACVFMLSGCSQEDLNRAQATALAEGQKQVAQLKETAITEGKSKLNGSSASIPSGDSALLAPVGQGQSLKLIHGYNDPLPINCPGPSLPSPPLDHCLNQRYGLDFQPVTTTATEILSPLPGKVDWIKNGCLGITTRDNLNLNICHFTQFHIKEHEEVKRGQVLGIMQDHIHLSLDDRHSPPQKLNAKQMPPVAFNRNHTIEGQAFDPDDNKQDEYHNTKNPLIIISTNVRIPTQP